MVCSDAQEDVTNHADHEVREQDAQDPIMFRQALYADDAVLPGLSTKLKRLQAYVTAVLENLHRGGSEENRFKTTCIKFTGEG